MTVNDWNICSQHEWEVLDSMGNSQSFTDVRCVRCGVPGQLDNATNEVYYPAT